MRIEWETKFTICITERSNESNSEDFLDFEQLLHSRSAMALKINFSSFSLSSHICHTRVYSHFKKLFSCVDKKWINKIILSVPESLRDDCNFLHIGEVKMLKDVKGRDEREKWVKNYFAITEWKFIIWMLLIALNPLIYYSCLP